MEPDLPDLADLTDLTDLTDLADLSEMSEATPGDDTRSDLSLVPHTDTLLTGLTLRESWHGRNITISWLK